MDREFIIAETNILDIVDMDDLPKRLKLAGGILVGLVVSLPFLVGLIIWIAIQ
jgi:hypothetical protein